MPWTNEMWMLNYANCNREKGTEEITFENAKRVNVSAKVRLGMEQTWGQKKVTKLFGKASHLERAEMLLLEIEEGKISRIRKFGYLINISYQIENACRKIDEETLIGKEYFDLIHRIPISILERATHKTWNLGVYKLYDFHQERVFISVEDLKKMKTWLFSTKEAKENLPRKVFFEYIFELTYISLKEIFKEVKAEITGK